MAGQAVHKEIEQYYNKFNEEKRFNSRHGQVEYRISMEYIHAYIDSEIPKSEIKILDIGAGTGRYAVPLAEEGYDVTAIEPVRHNLGRLKAKGSSVKAKWGNALDLSKLQEEQFDLTLVFGPLYHLFCFEDKRKALEEAKRVTKTGGMIFAAYCMNEYAVLTYAFREKNLKACQDGGRLTEDFHCISESKDLYDYVRLEDIESLNRAVGLKREKIISPDGPANYMRLVLKEMDEITFESFLQYQLATCERPDLLGAGAHTVDILRKVKESQNALGQV